MRYLLFAIALAPAAVSAAEQPISGQALHDANCVRCHSSTVYTRDNRRVKSLPQLKRQVRFCKDNLGLTWFDDEVEAVAEHLNRTYYHFGAN